MEEVVAEEVDGEVVLAQIAKVLEDLVEEPDDDVQPWKEVGDDVVDALCHPLEDSVA